MAWIANFAYMFTSITKVTDSLSEQQSVTHPVMLGALSMAMSLMIIKERPCKKRRFMPHIYVHCLYRNPQASSLIHTLPTQSPLSSVVLHCTLPSTSLIAWSVSPILTTPNLIIRGSSASILRTDSCVAGEQSKRMIK